MQVIDHPQRGEFGDGKLSIRAGVNFTDHQRNAILTQGLTELTVRAETTVAAELIAFIVQHLEGEDLLVHPFRQGKGGNFCRFILPPHQPFPARAKQREGVFGDRNIQIQIVHRFA